MELLSKGTKLMYSATSEGTYKALYGLSTTPEMGGTSEKVDVTNLNDANRRYIKGVKDLGDLEFGFFYNDADDNANVTVEEVAAAYSTLRAFDVAGTDIFFKLVYPDGTGFSWKGTVTVKRDSAAVNGALSFKLVTTVLTELKDISPSV